MQIQRKDFEHGTEIVIWRDDQPAPTWGASYMVTCLNFQLSIDGERQPPRASFTMLTPGHRITVESIRQIAAEYAQVADIAEALEAEKRAAYVERFGEA